MKNNNEYAKAYLELYEIIKNMSEEERDNIPEDYIKFLKNNMDKNHSFTYDKSKRLHEQRIKVETKALLVKLYERYFATPDEKEFWKEYNYKCFEKSEELKRNKYNSNIFDKKEVMQREEEDRKTLENAEKIEMIEYEKDWKRKIINFFKRLFRINKE